MRRFDAVRSLVARWRRPLVIGLFVVWFAGAVCFIVGLETIGLAVLLVSGALEILAFLAVPHAAAAATQFDGSYAAATGGLREPVETGPRPPAEIRRR